MSWSPNDVLLLRALGIAPPVQACGCTGARTQKAALGFNQSLWLRPAANRTPPHRENGQTRLERNLPRD